MAKARAKKSKKRQLKTVWTLKPKSTSAKTGLVYSLAGKSDFPFPSNHDVKIVGSKALKGGVQPGLQKLRKKYKSRGYRILGTTDDGVVIVRPQGKPDSFDLNQLEQVFSGVANAKFK